jgi:hypothetical protein
VLTVLAVGTVLMPLAACGSDEPGPSAAAPSSPPTASPSAASPPPASPSPASPPAPGSPPVAPARTTPGSPTTPQGPPATTVPPGPGELPGELPHGNRKLTGVVELSGGCALLRVGDRLWGLTGSPAQGLRAGDRVTVQGQFTTADGGCADAGATRSMVVRRVTRA